MAEPAKLRRPPSPEPPSDAREWVAAAFTRVEDVVYVSLGVLLAVSALALLVGTAVSVAGAIMAGSLPHGVIDVLDRILLVVMIVELLYTVQVSFREHALVPEPPSRSSSSASSPPPGASWCSPPRSPSSWRKAARPSGTP